MPKTNFPNGITAPLTDANGDAIADLTDNSGGTVADTIAAIGATYSQSEVANAVASLAAKIQAIKDSLDG